MELAERQRLHKKELQKLNKIFKAVLDDDDYKKAETLIENAAFIRASLTELRGDLMELGFVEHYQNGEHQSGLKDSSHLRAYNNLLKNYHTTIKLLLSIAPAAKSEVKDDGFDSF